MQFSESSDILSPGASSDIEQIWLNNINKKDRNVDCHDNDKTYDKSELSEDLNIPLHCLSCQCQHRLNLIAMDTVNTDSTIELLDKNPASIISEEKRFNIYIDKPNNSNEKIKIFSESYIDSSDQFSNGNYNNGSYEKLFNPSTTYENNNGKIAAPSIILTFRKYRLKTQPETTV